MASFIPLSFQKRLLRYALSRIDILDADALDLDRLEFGWHADSTLEVRNVALHTQKVAALLSLSPTLAISRASVEFLKLTVPTNLYASPIKISLRGVRVVACIEDRPDPQPAATSTQAPSLSENKNAQHTKMKDHSVALPTPRDVAQSFLDQEPMGEKVQLEADLAAQPSDSAHSVASSEEAEDSNTGYGLASGLSLPIFLAQFIRDIVDRLHVLVEDVSIRIESSINPPLAVHEGEEVALCISISSIESPGVLKTDSNTASDDAAFWTVNPGRIGKRLFAANGLSLNLQSSKATLANWRSIVGKSALPREKVSPTHSWPGSAAGESVQAHDLQPSRSNASNIDRRSPQYESPDEVTDCKLEDSRNQQSVPRSSLEHAAGFQDVLESVNAVKKPVTPRRGVTDAHPVQSASYEQHETQSSHAMRDSAHSSWSDTTDMPQALLESQLFSSQQAESIYMSVLDLVDQEKNQYPVENANEKQEAVFMKLGFNPERESSFTSFDRSSGPGLHRSKSCESANFKSANPTTQISLLSVSSIAAWIPTNSQHDADRIEPIKLETSPTRSSQETPRRTHMPGSFSIYQEPREQPVSSASNQSDETPVEDQDKKTSSLPSSAVECHIRDVVSSLDVSACAMVYQLLRHFQDSFPIPRKENAECFDGPQAQATELGRPVELTVSSLRLTVHDHLRFAHETQAASIQDSWQDTGLAQLHLETIRFQNYDGERRVSFSLQIHRALFYVAGQEILSFDHSSPLKGSMKASQHLENPAVCVAWEASCRNMQVNVVTTPVKLHLDLRELDESLATFGGVSGLFEVGSIVVSEANAPWAARASADGVSRQRSVHFDSTPQEERHMSSSRLSIKANIRLGGLEFVLKSDHSRLSLHTSAIKVVYRASIIGFQIDRMTVTGPESANLWNEATAKFEVRNCGIKYLLLPEEQDLSKLVSLLAPSKKQYTSNDDDDLMVDTLIKQRRYGPVARLKCSSLILDIPNEGTINALADLRVDLSRMSNIKQYLPKESRPGLLVLGSVDVSEVRISDMPSVGKFNGKLDCLEIAHVSNPLLVAFACHQIGIVRNHSEELLHPISAPKLSGDTFMLMAQYVGDGLNPAWTVKMHNTCIEYDAGILAEIQGVAKEPVQESPRSHTNPSPADTWRDSTEIAEHHMVQNVSPTHSTDMTRLNLDFRDCAVGLKPYGLSSKGIMILSTASIKASLQEDGASDFQVLIQQGNMLLIDCDPILKTPRERNSRSSPLPPAMPIRPLALYQEHGYVSVCWVSGAEACVRVMPANPSGPRSIDVEFQDELFVLETCADSTQTLTELFGALLPPSGTPQVAQKFLTEIAPVDDMMASFTGDTFTVLSDRIQSSAEAPNDDALDSIPIENIYGDSIDQSHFLPCTSIDTAEGTQALRASSALETISGGLKATNMPSDLPAGVCTWNSNTNHFTPVTAADVQGSPCAIRVHNVHAIWNLHDGYDWLHTRETISKAVHDVMAKAHGRTHDASHAANDVDKDEPVINDFLFNSIYVGVSMNQEPRTLTAQINQSLDDASSETTSHSSNDMRNSKSRVQLPKVQSRKLKLERSKRHKMTFELKRLSANFILFAAGSSNVSSTVVNVGDLEVFDHVPTSTWKKFATYQQDSGVREDRKSMVRLEVCDVRPVPKLSASELVVRVTVLPLRLHIDQDALDFMTRFFEFRDSDAEPKQASGSAYLQRVEVRPVSVKLDYKPKSVDFAGLRSGRTKEFMNFFNLDGADILLKHAIIYGCPNFARLHQNLEDIWMPDIKRNQLPSILSGLNGVRTVVNVGSGIRNLIVIPVQEYRRDGRIVLSIVKGASSFARTSGSELTRLGARLAVGAQNALQGAEGLLTRAPQVPGLEEDDAPVDIHLAGAQSLTGRQSYQLSTQSNFADQPAGILQGLKGAARSLERDLLLTRNVIIAVSGELLDDGSAGGAARAVARHAPTLVLRPMIGATKAISQTLMGVSNAVDPKHRERLDDKYKRH